MKNRNVKKVLVGLLSTLLLTGCGEAPYELTESEEAIIVNYSAHVVSKFNTRQADGIKYVEIAEEPVEEPIEETEEIIEIAEETEEVVLEDGTIVSEDGIEEDEAVQTATWNELFGLDGVELSYAGYELKKDYIQDAAYAVNAGNGKIYLVLNIDITNNSEADVILDNLSKDISFKISCVTDAGEEKQVSSYTTILTNDFSTYEKTLAPEETDQAVLLFEISENVTSVEQMKLTVEINETSYQIIL